MKRVNQETITGKLSWNKILPLNGFNLIRAKQLLRKRKRVQGSFSSCRKSQKSFTLTIRWNLGEHVRFYHGITALQLLIDPKQKSRVTSERRTSAVLSQSGLAARWWAGSLECYRYLRHVQDLLADGKNFIWKTIRRTIRRTINSFLVQ